MFLPPYPTVKMTIVLSWGSVNDNAPMESFFGTLKDVYYAAFSGHEHCYLIH